MSELAVEDRNGEMLIPGDEVEWGHFGSVRTVITGRGVLVDRGDHLAVKKAGSDRVVSLSNKDFRKAANCDE